MEPLQSDRPQLLGKRKREGSSEETYVASAASMDLDEDQEESEDHGPECFSKYFPTVPVNSNAITVPASGVRIIELSSDEEGNSGSAEQDIAQVIDHDSDSDVIILSARNVGGTPPIPISSTRFMLTHFISGSAHDRWLKEKRGLRSTQNART